jgi:hypothetical protein
MLKSPEAAENLARGMMFFLHNLFLTSITSGTIPNYWSIDLIMLSTPIKVKTGSFVTIHVHAFNYSSFQ